MREFRDQIRETQSDIANCLATGPLYSKVRYKGSLAYSDKPNTVKTLPPPLELSLHCKGERCAGIRLWKWSSGTCYVTSSTFTLTYTCKNCLKESQIYFVIWKETEDAGEFIKVGQYPALELAISPHVKLSTDDLKLYRRAIMARHAGHGLGSLAYLRRVVENSMNALIDLCAEAERANGIEVNDEELDEAKQRMTLTDKAEFANKHLPERLKGGHNPFKLLAGFASVGVHSGSEEECTESLDDLRDVMDGLFADLKFEISNTTALRKALKKLAAKTEV